MNPEAPRPKVGARRPRQEDTAFKPSGKGKIAALASNKADADSPWMHPIRRLSMA